VCPNSSRLKDYLIKQTGCDPEKVLILPNATRSSNILPRPASPLQSTPHEMRSIPRPIAGVIGNLAGNMDWELIAEVIESIPDISWVFVGPTDMPIPSANQELSRTEVMSMKQAHFLGKQPYGSLASFARAFDVAVLPYKRCEPTYSGSSTRFYEHLAAGRPMIATRGLEELVRKEPLLYLVDTAAETTELLTMLVETQFDDGLAEARWLASLDSTWQVRAQSMKSALSERLSLAPLQPDHRFAVGMGS
jgi:glycosyltransferase involved in cell wall biosynthesis